MERHCLRGTFAASSSSSSTTTAYVPKNFLIFSANVHRWFMLGISFPPPRSSSTHTSRMFIASNKRAGIKSTTKTKRKSTTTTTNVGRNFSDSSGQIAKIAEENEHADGEKEATHNLFVNILAVETL